MLLIFIKNLLTAIFQLGTGSFCCLRSLLTKLFLLGLSWYELDFIKIRCQAEVQFHPDSGFYFKSLFK